ncbi:MAG: NUDIX domain-containing protein [Candidatus Dojkabacteria bacterium]|nr:NUDIX domain-containing protein [Candidatus Dojkabacteria bacterium]MDQ7020844.1 NUDIX domain-containing protein [Candidatus Dojkabacteria bacterium]
MNHKKYMKPIGNKEIKYKGKIIAVTNQLFDLNGKEVVFEFAERAPGVRMIVEKDEKILLTKEYRNETKSYDYRLAGGKVFDRLEDYLAYVNTSNEVQEAAEVALKKEAKEELGIEVISSKLSHVSVCGATINWNLYYFIITDLNELDEQELEDGEDIKLSWFSKDEVREICLNGEISEERSAIALLRYIN